MSLFKRNVICFYWASFGMCENVCMIQSCPYQLLESVPRNTIQRPGLVEWGLKFAYISWRCLVSECWQHVCEYNRLFTCYSIKWILPSCMMLLAWNNASRFDIDVNIDCLWWNVDPSFVCLSIRPCTPLNYDDYVSSRQRCLNSFVPPFTVCLTFSEVNFIVGRTFYSCSDIPYVCTLEWLTWQRSNASWWHGS